jgi:hypothetical protein
MVMVRRIPFSTVGGRMLAVRSNKRMGTEKVKKEEVVQCTQLDNKSPIQVPYDEGIANHIDPESCAGFREGVCEALTGERAGQAIEPRK